MSLLDLIFLASMMTASVPVAFGIKEGVVRGAEDIIVTLAFSALVIGLPVDLLLQTLLIG